MVVVAAVAVVVREVAATAGVAVVATAVETAVVRATVTAVAKIKKRFYE